MINKTKISWCDYTWNCVIGCHEPACPYCYAKRLNERYGFIKDWNIPEWRERTFRKKFPKKPARIFVNSMSDINFWEPEWMAKVLNRVRQYPQHTFLFLTKFINCYLYFTAPSNCWLGWTVTNPYNYLTLLMQILIPYKNKVNKTLISIEPIQEDMMLEHIGSKNIDWIIIGAETGTRKEKVIPKREWIQNIVDFCREHKIPVFLKGSLKDIWGEKLIQEWPE